MKKESIELGSRFTKLVVVSELPISRGTSRRFLCQCDCGNKKEVFLNHLKRNNIRSCGCIHPKKEKHYKWTGIEDMPGSVHAKIVSNARGKGRGAVDIDINMQDIFDLYVKQDRKCALTRLPIEFKVPYTASLDRIDSNKGYLKGNIQWVHKDVNRMKNVFSQERFIEICNLISETHNGNNTTK